MQETINDASETKIVGEGLALSLVKENFKEVKKDVKAETSLSGED